MPRTMGTSASRPATPKTRRAIPPPATMMTHTGRSRVPIPSSSGAPPTSHHPVSLAVKLVVFLVSSPLITYHPVSLAVKLVVFLVSSPLITYHPVSLAVKLVVFLVASPITPSLWLSSLSSSLSHHPSPRLSGCQACRLPPCLIPSLSFLFGYLRHSFFKISYSIFTVFSSPVLSHCPFFVFLSLSPPFSPSPLSLCCISLLLTHLCDDDLQG